MSYDLLGQSKVKRLTYRGSKWCLEVTRLIGKSGVYHPELDYLRSPRAILGFLDTYASRELAAEARVLLAKPPAKDTSYEAASGVWVAHGTVTDPPPSRGHRGGRAAPEIQALKEELARVRAMCSELRLNLTQLEGEVARLRSGVRQPTAQQPRVDEIAPSVRIPQTVGRPPASVREPLIEPQAPKPEPPNVDAGPAAPAAPVEAVEAPAPVTTKALTLPSSEKLLKCISKLLDQPLTGTPIKKPPVPSSAPENWYISVVIDNSGTEVGALLGDIEATVRLGATLMMQPAGVIQEQLSAGTPDESSTESMSEIFNTASSTFNEVKGNAHCRMRPLHALKDLEIPWLDQARAQMAIQLGVGGVLLCLGR
ncbi:MAG: hypothetical protein SFV15_07435 [Polyangiaceae bacterium]|nr:hypothetical protein [Polyangiaceae bacterium]